MVTLSDGDDSFDGSNAEITVLTGSTVAISGDDNTVSAGANVAMTVTGGGNAIQTNTGWVTIAGAAGQADVLSGTDLEVSVDAGSHVILNGSIVAFTLGAKCLVVATGDNTSFQGSDDRIYISEATVGGDSVTGSGNRVIVAGGSLLELNGSDNIVHFGAKADVAVTGTNQRLVGAGFYGSAASADFWIGGNGASGAMDLVSATESTIRIGANSNIFVTGEDDTITACLDTMVDLEGTGLFAHFGHYSTINLTGKGVTGALDTLTGAYLTVSVNSSANAELATFTSHATLGDHVVLALERAYNTITAGNSDTISILWGLSNQITLGQDDVITDGGVASMFHVGNAVGATTINNFGADPGGVIELLNGVGGYATANNAFAALSPDGDGGVRLALGIYGSIDFAGTAASQLSAANFKIG